MWDWKDIRIDALHFVRITFLSWVPPLTLIYPTLLEDVQCQSGVNHIYYGLTEIQLYNYAS